MRCSLREEPQSNKGMAIRESLGGGWKLRLAREIADVGFAIDLSRVKWRTHGCEMSDRSSDADSGLGLASIVSLSNAKPDSDDTLAT